MLVKFRDVGIAVNDLESAVERYTAAFGWTLIEETERLGARIAILDAGGINITLLAPTPGEVPLTRFLETRGEGFYRIHFDADDFDATLAQLDDAGIRYNDFVAPSGARLAFTSPRGAHGLMIEITEPAG